nr:MAG TPA: hypothetical protein [Caudoviricetes sp.]
MLKNPVFKRILMLHFLLHFVTETHFNKKKM